MVAWLTVRMVEIQTPKVGQGGRTARALSQCLLLAGSAAGRDATVRHAAYCAARYLLLLTKACLWCLTTKCGFIVLLLHDGIGGQATARAGSLSPLHISDLDCKTHPSSVHVSN